MIGIKTLDQDVYDSLYTLSQSLGYDTFTDIPPKGTRYPFVMIGNVQVVAKATANRLLGSIFTTIDVYDDATHRQRLSNMANAIFMAAIGLRQTSNYGISANKKGCDIEITTDSSVPNTTLYHGILTLEYRIL